MSKKFALFTLSIGILGMFIINACSDPKIYPTPLQEDCLLTKYSGDYRYHFRIIYNTDEKPVSISEFYDSTLIQQYTYRYFSDKIIETYFTFADSIADSTVYTYILNEDGYATAFLAPSFGASQYDTTYYVHDSNGYVVEEKTPNNRYLYLIKNGNRIRRFTFDYQGNPVDTTIYEYDEKLNRGAELYGMKTILTGKLNKNLIRKEQSVKGAYTIYSYGDFQGRYPLQVLGTRGNSSTGTSLTSTYTLQYSCK